MGPLLGTGGPLVSAPAAPGGLISHSHQPAARCIVDLHTVMPSTRKPRETHAGWGALGEGSGDAGVDTSRGAVAIH